jgi:hypothetical protein
VTSASVTDRDNEAEAFAVPRENATEGIVEYPDPGDSIAMDDTPAFKKAVADAITVGWSSVLKEIVGAEVYPDPPSVTSIVINLLPAVIRDATALAPVPPPPDITTSGATL